MRRNALLELIRDYAERWPDESSTIDRFDEFVRRCPGCFERSLKEGHITGSAWVVDLSDRVLLTHHRKLDIWVQLGGHADGEPDIARVALEEAKEESGLDQLSLKPEIFDLDIHMIPARKADPEHLHYDVRFVVNHLGNGEFVVSDESHDLAWVDVENIQEVTTEESMLRMKRKWLDQMETN